MKINLEDQFYQNNFRKIGKHFIEKFLKNLQIEQIAFRMYLCEKCLENGKCSQCQCNAIDMITEPFSCNSEKIFPNFMNNEKWEAFKKQNNIIIENELHL